jgi:membrane associated rhomboid family serine protease
MLVPIGHEQTSARRLPMVTIALIAINCIVFAFTNASGALERESAELATLRSHIRILAAMAPELTVPPVAQQVVSDFRDHYPDQWRQLSNPNRDVIDGWDAHIRLMADDPTSLQKEMDSAAQQYATLSTTSSATQYAFVPAHPTLISYFTSSFIHGGWLHLIFNMWFLWLAGVVLEDVWGRVLYPVFFLIAGAVANQVHAWANPGSNIAAIGASGAVAALMGAFLIRFPKMKIEMVWLIALRVLHFKVPAYWILPFWFLMEVFYGALMGDVSAVAHWAHIGGFVFGAVVAVALKYSGLEHTVTEAVEKKVGVVSGKEVGEASELLERGKLDEARNTLSAILAKKPDSVDALSMMKEIHRRRAEDASDTTAKLCSAYLREKNFEAAWQEYQEYLQAGNTKLPAAVWLSLCRGLEEQQNFEASLAEYVKLIAAYPTERQSLMAQLQAAGVCLRKLNRPQDALKFYEGAATSPIPHLDLDATIQLGIKSANSALMGSKASAASGA